MILPAEALAALFRKRSYGFVEPPILHDADLFLDLAGEDLRRRLFLTQSPDGVELCLRPDYTIPVCLHHITNGLASRRGDYAYIGPVFRQRPGETGEFSQGGIESIGREDRTAADADTLALALEAVALYGVAAPAVRIGDSALFAALLDALSLPEIWRRRLRRAFGDGPKLSALITRLADASREPVRGHAGLLAALEGSDHATARGAVDDMLAMAGITAVGGRSAAEIADRFLEQAALAAGAEQGERAAGILQRFLAIGGTPPAAARALAHLAAEEGLDLSAALSRFDDRTHGLARRGVDPDSVVFAADFGRRLDYYTGFVFEMADPAQPESGPIVGGGRYDRLLSLIVARDGSGPDIPAVGFAMWLDRLGNGRR